MDRPFFSMGATVTREARPREPGSGALQPDQDAAFEFEWAPTAAVAELQAAVRLAIRQDSPDRPMGRFSYSDGLEQAVEAGWIVDRPTAARWVSSVLVNGLGRFDVPLLARLFEAWSGGNTRTARRLDAWVLAGRGSAELQAREIRLGSALRKLLPDRVLASQTALPEYSPRSFLGVFALAATRSGFSQAATLGDYCLAWLEHQTTAAAHLVPLGQADAQRMLRDCHDLVDRVIERGRTLADEEIGGSMPGLAIASALHESHDSARFSS